MQLTVREAAQYFGVDDTTVRRWIADRGLPVHRINERWYLNAIEAWEWALANGVSVSRRLLDEARRAPDEVPPLSRLLEAGGIHRDARGGDKHHLLADVVAKLPLPPDVDRDHLLAILEAREAMGSTGIGQGIAIPHVRNPILLRVPESFVSLFLLRHPVDFESIDGQAVHALFLVVSPTVPTHLRILAQLGFVLRDATLKDLLHQRAANEAILDRIRDLEPQATGSFPVARTEP